MGDDRIVEQVRNGDNSDRWVSWRALGEYERRQATEHRNREDRLSERLRAVEGVIDQQRGARTLIYALIGTNLLMAVSVIAGVIAVLR